jgi:hypothetical protein
VSDLGGLGRGLLKGARSAKDRAEEALRRNRDDEPDKPNKVTEPEPTEVALADEPEEQADDAEVAELVERLRALLERRRPAAGPIAQPWSLGVGDLLAEYPKVPKRLRGLVRRLNRFGGIAVTPETIAFDGEDVDWHDVTEVRTRHVVDYLLGDAVQQQVENLPMPWFPGRRRVLDALGKAMLTVTIATAKDQLDDLGLDLRIPAEVEYRGALRRRKTLGPGVLAAIVLADPAVNRCVTATARARGIPVRVAGDDDLPDAAQRADAVRAKVAALEAELERFGRRFGRKS